MRTSSRIYLDHAATTPCDPQVVEAMLPYFTGSFANPGSALYPEGRHAQQVLEQARVQVASLIGADAPTITFCGSATESINLALLGLARGTRAAGRVPERRTILTLATEHKAVLACCKQLELEGFTLHVLPVLPSGRVDLEAFQRHLDAHTLLVSIQAANNETGVLQDIPALASRVHAAGAMFHCDASQAVGKLPCDVLDWEVDALSFSAHKLYGPKGMGALYLRGGAQRWPIQPILHGGGQERGLRSGTPNVAGAVGFGVACALAHARLESDRQHLRTLRDALEARVQERVPSVRINGAEAERLPGASSLTFPGVDGEALILRCPGLALSTGSACMSGAPEPSHVLLAMGIPRELAWQTVRVGVGRSNTLDDVLHAADLLGDGAS